MSLPVSAKEVPFFKLLIPFILGISCQYWLEMLTYSLINNFIILISLGLIFLGYLLSSQWKFRWLFGVFLYIFLFFAGAIITVKKPTHEKLNVITANKAIVLLLDNPQIRTKTIRVQVEVKYIFENNFWYQVNEKMLIYFDLKDSLALKLRYGSILATEIKPILVLPSTNPKQFDFKKYLSDRGVNFTAYLKPDKWILVGEEGLFIKKIAFTLRDKLISLFKSAGLSGDELAVASALTLGYQDLLDDELRQIYSSSGAMHILSVSGLHVGILYIMLSFLLRFLDKNTSTRILKAIILLIFLWFFALLTGIPPCVQRSALMFSFVVVGDCFSRKSSIYNTIAASAFILLAVNPLNLVDIGFQLSYLAVISIVFFYPFIYKLVYVKYRVIDMVWSLIAVSIAAQIGTFGLCTFYFSQFPNYFLLSNLVAIPLSTIALYLSVLLIIVSPFALIAGFVGKLFSFTITLLNNSLEYIEKLPYSVSEGLNITSLQLLFIVLVTLFISLYIVSKKYYALLFVLISLASFLTINLFSTYEGVRKNEIVVFDVPKKSLLSLRSGNELLFLDFDTTQKYKNPNNDDFFKNYGFYTKGYISSIGVNKQFAVYNPYAKDESYKKISSVNLYDKNGVIFIHFNNNTIAVPHDNLLKDYTCTNSLSVDYLLVRSDISKNIFNFINPKMVIIDRSVTKKIANSITLLCNENNTPVHIISSQGAFILKTKI
ncbi:MAG: ComEC/Rec2 family competence protein [Tenuifilaceae bacterium]